MNVRIPSSRTLAILFAGVAFSLPAAALTCPPGQVERGTPPQCEKRDQAKPQLDVAKYSGAQKAEAEACNKANAAHAVIMQAGEEIERLNASINAAQHEVQDAAKGAAKDAAKAKVADLKAKRKVEEDKLKQAQADELAGNKEHRKAVKAVKKEKAEPLNCI